LTFGPEVSQVGFGTPPCPPFTKGGNKSPCTPAGTRGPLSSHKLKGIIKVNRARGGVPGHTASCNNPFHDPIMIAFKVFIFTVLAPGSATVLAPYLILSLFDPSLPFEIGFLRRAGWIFIFLGAFFYFWTVWDFAVAGRGTPAPMDPPKKLVVRGLYRCVRNPMYVAVVSILFGETLVFSSPLLLVYTFLVFLSFHLFVVGYEEPKLRNTFGDAYKAYCDSVPRWIPQWKD